MSNSTTLNVRGFKVRSQSQRRYLVVVVSPNERFFQYAKFTEQGTEIAYETISPGARIHKRSDNLETARAHRNRYGFPKGGNYAVVMDAYTGQEIS